MIVVYPTITIPVSVWLLIGFLKAVPKDVEEQAMVDGYSRLGAFLRTVLPLVFPGIVAVVVFSFTLASSEFVYARRCRSLFLFNLFLDRFVAGFTMGAVKT